MDTGIENLHVFSEDAILTPAELKRRLPLTEKAAQTVLSGRSAVKEILERKDPRVFVVVGPCSVHDVEATYAYALRLKTLAEEVEDTLLVAMRVYFEKPRTQVGWQGFINDPRLDGTCRIDEGLYLARKLLLDLAELELPAAGEALDLVTPQYVQDLFSWTAIGARTTESQSHRKMASGFSCAVGFKNGTTGNIAAAVNGMLSAASPNNFLSVNPEGNVAIIRTKGNPHTHIILRGGDQGPNYDAQSISACEKALRKAGLPINIMVDCSHGNSHKQPEHQADVLKELGRQIRSGNQSVIGVMVESNLQPGNQPLQADVKNLQYGLSITDPCLGWETTAMALRKFREDVKEAVKKRAEAKPEV